jgi:hypothetical protein
MASPVKYSVRINGRLSVPSEQVEGNAAWATALAFGHSKEVTFCECERGARVPLSVKHYGASSSRSHYGLARWQGTGLDHALSCIYFSDEGEEGKAGTSNPAFHELAGGMLRVHAGRGRRKSHSAAALRLFGQSGGFTKQAAPSDNQVVRHETSSIPDPAPAWHGSRPVLLDSDPAHNRASNAVSVCLACWRHSLFLQPSCAPIVNPVSNAGASCGGTSIGRAIQ